MTTEDPDDPGRCICCGVPLASCGKAIEEAARTRERVTVRRGRGTELEANFPGVCADCRTPFAAGALIEWDPELDSWRALACCP